MDIRNFIYEQGVLGVTIATLLGFGGTNFISDIREYIISPLIVYIFLIFGIKRKNEFVIINILSSFIEFLIVILVVYLIYKFIILRIFEKQMQNETLRDKMEKRAINDITAIRKELVSDVSDIHSHLLHQENGQTGLRILNVDSYYVPPKL